MYALMWVLAELVASVTHSYSATHAVPTRFSFTVAHTKVPMYHFQQGGVLFIRARSLRPAQETATNPKRASREYWTTGADALRSGTTGAWEHCSGVTDCDCLVLLRNDGERGVCARVSAAARHVRLHAPLLFPRDGHAQQDPGVLHSIRVRGSLLSSSALVYEGAME